MFLWILLKRINQERGIILFHMQRWLSWSSTRNKICLKMDHKKNDNSTQAAIKYVKVFNEIEVHLKKQKWHSKSPKKIILIMDHKNMSLYSYAHVLISMLKSLCSNPHTLRPMILSPCSWPHSSVTMLKSPPSHPIVCI